MMRRRWLRGIAATLVALGLGWTARSAEAQSGVSALGGATGSPAAMLANPYLNPYLNPYMNPVATQRPISGRDAAMYMYMANQANGGLGSGVISGTRPAPGAALAAQGGGLAIGRNVGGPAAAGAAGGPGGANAVKANVGPRGRAQQRVAEMPDSVAFPGAGAARFFNPGPVNAAGAGKYYARRNTYFNSNGH